MADKLSLTLLHLLQTQLLILLIRRLCWFCLFLTWLPADDDPVKMKEMFRLICQNGGFHLPP